MTDNVVAQIESTPGVWVDYARTNASDALSGSKTINGKAIRFVHWIEKETVLTSAMLHDMVTYPTSYDDKAPIDYEALDLLDEEPEDTRSDFEKAYGLTGFVFVNVYEMFREFGGPEEGGWYYDRGEFIAGRMVKADDAEALAAAERELEAEYPSGRYMSWSVMYMGGDYSIRAEAEPGKSFPENIPHYE